MERIHGSVVPADVRAGDPVTAQLRVVGRGERSTPARVWRLSPIGVELVRPSEIGPIAVGTPIDLTLYLAGQACDFSGLPVLGRYAERDQELLGVSWAQQRAAGNGVERRGPSRYGCDRDYPPTGIGPSAVRYRDFVYFRVLDISWGGMQLETSLRNKFIVPGMELKTTCTFPTLGQVCLELRVVHVRVVTRGQKQVLSVGVRYSSGGAEAVGAMGQYLLQFGSGITVQDLCAQGFRIPSSSRALDFCSIRTPEEYREVLRLRRLAYVHARKLGEETKDLDTGDSFDARSRILVAKHRGRVVGSIRLMFPESEGDRLNHEQFLELPRGLPPRREMVELFKACTHPGYRGSDLFYVLIRQAALIILQAGRRYALMSATDALAPVYARFGFRRVGTAYQHPTMRLRHHLMMVDVPRVAAGVGINPLSWNLAGAYEVWTFARRCGAIRAGRRDVARVWAFRLLAPLARALRPLINRWLRASGVVR
ncbi:MAG TPA: GNAT family N-acyltransferase [Anaeromyxobacter sp.]|nr:GNAT family N-acyltransferase [Anaeromyxobacter sp.]